MTAERRQLQEELYRRKLKRQAILDGLHAKQRAVVQALLLGIQYIAVLCGRRAGKTEMDARIIAIALEMCGHNEWVIYAALTRKLAKDLIWVHLVRLNEEYGFGWKMLHHEGAIETPRGGRFRVLGFDDTTELDKVRGYKLRAAVFDEPATYADKLEVLIRDIVGPALSDLRGWLVINGTPGHVCVGWWYEVSTGQRDRFKTFGWTVRDNPLYPRDAEAMLAEERAENHWTEEDPSYQREWMGVWVNDPNAQIYKYAPGRDDVYVLPDGYQERGGSWTFTMGLDFGYYPDPCSWSVLGSPRDSQDTYLVYDDEEYSLLPDEWAERTKALVERFELSAAVGDPSAPEYIAEWNRRHAEKAGIWVLPADKLGKMDAIKIFNDEMRSKRFKVYRPGLRHWPGQATALPYKNEKREEEHPRYPNHTTDGTLYASRKHRAYLHVVPKPPPKPDEAAKLAQQERIRKVQEQRRAEREQEEEW